MVSRREAVSRRSATSDPSTRYTRGSPPGALKPTSMRCPGKNPRTIKCRASSSGSSMDSRIASAPAGKSDNLHFEIMTRPRLSSPGTNRTALVLIQCSTEFREVGRGHSIPSIIVRSGGRLAQLVRALPLQGRGPGFESLTAHHSFNCPDPPLLIVRDESHRLSLGELLSSIARLLFAGPTA